MNKPAQKLEKPHYIGHRQRLRERFLAEPDALPDYELLELLLFASNPRGDTKPLAKTLLKQFGDLTGILSASEAELKKIDGIGDAAVVAIKTAHLCGIRMLQGHVMNKPVIASWKHLLDYCHARMAHQKTEEVRLLFLDAKNQMIADEKIQQGTVDQAAIYTREIVKRSLELHASAVIMVHNHPTGDPQPSKDDIAITKNVQKALAVVDIRLHDHLIIGKNGHQSLKSAGII